MAGETNWTDSLRAQRVFVDGTEVLPAAKSWNLLGFTATYNTSTKQVDIQVAGGFDWQESVRVATTANLLAVFAANTLTASSNGSINTAGIDGVTDLALNDRILLKNQTLAQYNGIYKLTDLGSVSTPWIMVRDELADENGEITPGMSVVVEEGTSSAGLRYVVTTTGTIVVNSTPINFGVGVAGEANTASNLGGGEGVFESKSGLDLRLKSIVGTAPVTAASSATEVSLGLQARLEGSRTAVAGSRTNSLVTWLDIGFFFMDLDLFPATGRSIVWEHAFRLSSGTGSAAIRLFNLTTGLVVTGSSLTTASASLVSAQTTLTPDATLTDGALNRIVTQISRTVDTGVLDFCECFHSSYHIYYG